MMSETGPEELTMLDRAKENPLKTAVIGGLVGLSATYGFVALVSVVCYKAAGITAGSWATKMMSASAIASGGGVAKGGLVACLQSIGALGTVSTATKAVATVTAGTATYLAAKKVFSRDN